MKNNLKKKTKKTIFIFPQALCRTNNNIQVLPSQQTSKKSQPRSLSLKSQSKNKRSSSLDKNRKYFKNTTIINQHQSLLNKKKLKKQHFRCLSQYQKSKVSTISCKIQFIQKNLLFVQRNSNFQSKQSISSNLISQSSIQSQQILQKNPKIINFHSKKNSQVQSLQSNQSQTNINNQKTFNDSNLRQNLIKNSKSIIKRKVLRQKSFVIDQDIKHSLLNQLQKKKIWFISPKITNKQGLIIIKDLSFQLVQSNFHLSFFIFIKEQYVLIKLISAFGKRSNFQKIKKAFIKQSSQNLFTFLLQKQYNDQTQHQFTQYLYLNIQKIGFIQRKYIGLKLNNYKNVKKTKQFYFIIRINCTFYLIKGVIKQDFVNFNIIQDFQRNYQGNQLVFQIQIQKNIQKRVSTKLVQKYSKQFQNLTKKQFLYNYSHFSNNQIQKKLNDNGKIIKSSKQCIQIWDDEVSSKAWNINKKYEMVGETVNFFKYHNSFDYNFFNKKNRNYRIEQMYYNFKQKDPISLYQYPHKYYKYKLNHVQKQILVIQHLSHLSSPFKKSFIKSMFLKKKKLKNQQQSKTIKLITGQKIINISEKKDNLRLLVQWRYKNTYHLIQEPKKAILFTIYNYDNIIKKVNEYKIQKSLVYSKLLKTGSSIQILYKALQRLQNHFLFCVLYKHKLQENVEFKVYQFSTCRSYIIKFEYINTNIQTKKLVSQLLNYFTGSSFKKQLFLQLQLRKKRQTLKFQVFYQKLQSIHKNYLFRPKKRELPTKIIDKIKNISIFQNKISKICKNITNKQCHLIIRQWYNLNKDELQICVFMQDSFYYYRGLSTIQKLLKLLQIQIDNFNYSNTQFIYKLISQKIVQVISRSRSMSNLIVELKNVLQSKQQEQFQIIKRKVSIYQNQLVTQQQQKLLRKPSLSSMASIKNHLQYQEQIFFQQKIIKKQRQKLLFINQYYYVSIVDYKIKVRDIRNLDIQSQIRNIYINNRQKDEKLILNNLQCDFLTNISYLQYNKRMLTRLRKCLYKIF